MSVFFKIGEDGKKVYVAKTIFAKEMSKENFENSAKRITVDDFLKKFSFETGSKLEKIINRVREINDMNLIKVQKLVTSNPDTRTTHYFYHIGDKVFIEDYGENVELKQEKEAMNYIVEKFGTDLANNHIIPAFKKNIEIVLCFSGREEIDKDTYENLKAEQNDLTSIKSLEKLLNKTNKR